MSLDKFKRGNSQQVNLLKSKLSILQNHIRRTQNLPLSLFMHPDLLVHLRKQKIYAQPTNQISLKQPKSFLLSERPVTRFFFNYIPITEDKRYCFRVEPSKTQLQIFMELDGQKKGSFLINHSKAILINYTDWKRVQFTIQVKKVEKLSTVKICIDTIVVEHKVKIHGVPSQRKIVDQQLKEYLKNNLNKQKINAILQKRKRKSMTFSRSSDRTKTASAYSSTKNLQSSRIFRNYSGFNESTSVVKTTSPIIRQPRIQSTQLKRDINYFQDSKQKFIKHLQKMSPQKARELQLQQKKYQIQKQQTLQSISTLINALIFMNHSYKLCVRVLRVKMCKIHIRLICKKFIKNLHQANKMRLTYRTRNKVTMDLNLSMISCFLWQTQKKKAQQRLMQRFKVQFFVLDITKVANLSLKYVQSAIKIQRKFRLVDKIYRLRFQAIAKRIKGYKFQNDEQFQLLFKKYKKYCYSKSRQLSYSFTKYHKKLDELMRDIIQQRNTKKI